MLTHLSPKPDVVDVLDIKTFCNIKLNAVIVVSSTFKQE